MLIRRKRKWYAFTLDFSSFLFFFSGTFLLSNLQAIKAQKAKLPVREGNLTHTAYVNEAQWDNLRTHEQGKRLGEQTPVQEILQSVMACARRTARCWVSCWIHFLRSSQSGVVAPIARADTSPA